MSDASSDVTALIARWREGDLGARDRVVSELYRELHRLAAAQLRREREGHTLQPTALVSEAVLRLMGAEPNATSRTHLLGIAARSMREVLVDHARRRQADKRGGDVERISLEQAGDIALPTDVDLLAVDNALRRLEELDPQQVCIVELRYFAGLTIDQTAAALELHPSAVNREWAAARAWLLTQLGP